MIVVTGDFINGSVAMRRADAASLAWLHTHEYFFDYANRLHHLSKLGFHMLLNRHAVITWGEARLVIAGVIDRSTPDMGRFPRSSFFIYVLDNVGTLPFVFCSLNSGLLSASASGRGTMPVTI